MTKKLNGRYTVSTDEEHEPNSNNQVLKNYLHITSKKEIEIIETKKLKETELELTNIYTADHKFTVDDICNIHSLWLGDIYPSAGKFRTVNMEKDGFPFAAANRIPDLMTQFERNYLSKYTPCHFQTEQELAFALAMVHIEFVLIHPFREGNGRTGRVLADLMVLQAGRAPLNFSAIDSIDDNPGFKHYIQAIHAGHEQNYSPLTDIFLKILKESG